MAQHETRSDERRAAAQAFYGPLAEHPDASRRVGWESWAAHRLRLAAIVEALLPLSEVASLIDVGCGEALLLPRLRAAGFTGHYRGEEVLAAPAERARANASGDARAHVVVCDGFAAAQAGEPAPRAAAVVCSGALNTISGPAIDHDREVRAALTTLWERAADVLVVDVAVHDRHAPGVGLARADLAALWAHARTLTPIVVVREDVVPGEASLVLSRARTRSYARRLPEPADRVLRAEALLAADEPASALALLSGDASAAALLVAGQCQVALGAARDALATLERAATLAAAEGDRALSDAARLAQAPALWRLGDKRKAEALLVELSEHLDLARVHLFELLMARNDHARAALLASTVRDAWTRRELEARLPARR